MRSTILLCAVLLISIAFISCQDECNGNDYGSAGQFDFYVLAQSWPAEFCFSHQSYPGCQHPTAWQQTNLTMHGLWPNYNQMQGGNHDWPQCCQSTYGSSITSSEMNPILSALQTYWPSEQNPNPNGDWSNSLWQHEWGKHGTCSGLPVTKYFQAGVNLAASATLATPGLITNNIGSTISASALQSAYNNGSPCSPNSDCMVGTSCKSGYLVGITTCWNKSMQQVICPAATVGQQCSGTIKVYGFNSQRPQPKVSEF
jgi:ribonuclease T2